MSFWSKARQGMPGKGLLREDRPPVKNKARKKRERRTTGLSAYKPSVSLLAYRKEMEQLEAQGLYGTSAEDAIVAAREIIESAKREQAEAKGKSQGARVEPVRPGVAVRHIPGEQRRPTQVLTEPDGRSGRNLGACEPGNQPPNHVPLSSPEEPGICAGKRNRT